MDINSVQQRPEKFWSWNYGAAMKIQVQISYAAMLGKFHMLPCAAMINMRRMIMMTMMFTIIMMTTMITSIHHYHLAATSNQTDGLEL